MSDNSTLPATGDVIATDDIGGVKYQRVKIAVGADGSADDMDSTHPVYVAQNGTWTVQPGNTANTTAWKVDASSVAVPITDNSGSLTVDNGGTFAVQAAQSGTWNVTNVSGTISLPSGASTETTLASVLAALGATSGAKVITDANGTVQQYLRGLVSQWISSTLTLAPRTGSFTASFTPAASAYSANDVMDVAKAMTLAGAAPAGEIVINSISLQIATGTIPSGQSGFSLKLYNVTPPSAHADNAAWDLPSGDRAAYLGAIDFAAPVDLGSTLQIDIEGLGKQITLATAGVLYGELVTIAGVTFAAVAHKATLHFTY